MNPIYHRFYFDETGKPCRNGMYCQIFDRWLIIDPYDHWITLETARLLSSKVTSIIYILPSDADYITNNNCLEYSLLHKTKQVKGIHPDLYRGQLPILKVIDGKNQVVHKGLHEEYKSGEPLEYLKNLKKYADFVQHFVYALKLLESQNYDDNRTFAESIISPDWLKPVSSRVDRSDVEIGVIKTIRQILYFSTTPEEARTSIDNLWKQEYANVPLMADYFHKLIGEKHELK
jgi:hypothetical protein